MTFYRKLPVVIEARSWNGSLIGAKNIGEWVGSNDFVAHSWESAEGCYLVITTLEGDMQAMPGDFIIKGVNGEFYPCKPDIFNKTYEVVS